jgi:hypothetical protein
VPAAIAAIASAAAAIGSFIWQRRSAIDAMRPELVFEEFSTEVDGSTRHIHAKYVKNVGSGPAIGVFATLLREDNDESSLLPVGGGNALSLVEAGGKQEIDFEIIMTENPNRTDLEIQRLRPFIGCSDRLGRRHNTTYTFYVSNGPIGLTQPIARNIFLADRTTLSGRGLVWWLRSKWNNWIEARRLQQATRRSAQRSNPPTGTHQGQG